MWEYKIIKLLPHEGHGNEQEEQNKLGRERWELTSALLDGDFKFFYFKRPLADPVEPIDGD